MGQLDQSPELLLSFSKEQAKRLILQIGPLCDDELGELHEALCEYVGREWVIQHGGV